MDLVRDLLDKQILDRRGKPIGRVDGIIMTVRGRAQPRVAYVAVGSVTQAHRLHVRLGRWVERIARRWGKMRPNPYRIVWTALSRDGGDFRVDVDAATVPTLAWERWLREHVIGRIPGA
jgi:hypothetical protein